MTIGWGDTGRVSIGIQRTMGITLKVAENNVTATALPTAMGTAQYTFTYNASTLAPTFSGVIPNSYKQVWIMAVSGQNTSGTAATVNYQINKNGVSFKTGNLSVTNNNYFTVSLQNVMTSGDVYDFYLWTSAASGVNYIYNGCCSVPSSVDIGTKIIDNSTWTVAQAYTAFTLTGHSGSAYNGLLFIAPGSNTSASSSTKSVSNNETIYLYQTHPTYKMFTTQGGDAGGVTYGISQHATNYPNTQQTAYPSQITWREITL